MTQIGIVSDIHGDLEGFEAALAICGEADLLLCPGDIVDRGPDADAVVDLIQAHDIRCIKGNHEHTILEGLVKRRDSSNVMRLRELGRIITDETATYLDALPETLSLTLEGVELLMAHGTPWSDVQGVMPDSHPRLFERLQREVTADVLILGHTHHPMQKRTGDLLIVNPGSVYGVTLRDSHTCGILTLPEMTFTVYDLAT